MLLVFAPTLAKNLILLLPKSGYILFIYPFLLLEALSSFTFSLPFG
jgi:hypothetical protein